MGRCRRWCGARGALEETGGSISGGREEEASEESRSRAASEDEMVGGRREVEGGLEQAPAAGVHRWMS